VINSTLHAGVVKDRSPEPSRISRVIHSSSLWPMPVATSDWLLGYNFVDNRYTQLNSPMGQVICFIGEMLANAIYDNSYI
jgi:hypothetical protein